MIRVTVLSFLVIFVGHCLASPTTIDNFKLGEFLEVSKNDFDPQRQGRSSSSDSTEVNVENYLKSHDVSFNFPGINSRVTVEGRNLDNDEISLKLNLNHGQVEARKSKLKKIIGPILIVVLLKAITLIPLALAILGFKTWNALQLSFVSFVIAIGMAVYNLCKKIVGDHVPPPIVTAHNPWESAARFFNDDEAQKLAYAAYA